MLCQKCNTENDNNAIFCSKCGTVIEKINNENNTTENMGCLILAVFVLIIIILVAVGNIVNYFGGNSTSKIPTVKTNIENSEKITMNKLKNYDGYKWKTMSYFDKVEIVNQMLENGRRNGMTISGNVEYYVSNLDDFYNSTEYSILNQKVVSILTLIGVGSQNMK